MADRPIEASPAIIYLDDEGRVVINQQVFAEVGAHDIEFADTDDSDSSHQTVAADLELDATAGTSDAGDTAFKAAGMFNILGDALTKVNTYVAGVIGALSVTGARATKLPQAAVMGVLMDGAVNGDSIVHAHIDGGDPSTQTNARAAFGVSQFNNHASSGVEYGVDLKYTPSAEVDALLGDSAEPFKVTKGLTRSPNDVVWLEGDGAPTSGASGTGDNFAGKGSMYTDYTNANLYIQIGAITSPDWKLVTRAA
jgi:hypothetical protein